MACLMAENAKLQSLNPLVGEAAIGCDSDDGTVTGAAWSQSPRRGGRNRLAWINPSSDVDDLRLNPLVGEAAIGCVTDIVAWKLRHRLNPLVGEAAIGWGEEPPVGGAG